MQHVKIILAGITILIVQTVSFAQTKDKNINKWFEKEDWLNGLTLKPHASINRSELKKQYEANKVLWDTAFAFLRQVNLDTIKPGKYSLIGDDITVSISDGPTKKFEDTRWESHRKYIDIQYIYRGKEKLGVYPSANAKIITSPYDEKRDVANYDISEGDFYISDPKTFFIFFPGDAHRPGTKADGFDTVKKIVFKVRVAN